MCATSRNDDGRRGGPRLLIDASTARRCPAQRAGRRVQWRPRRVLHRVRTQESIDRVRTWRAPSRLLGAYTLDERRPREPGGSRRCTRSQCKAGWPRVVSADAGVRASQQATEPRTRSRACTTRATSAATSPTSSWRWSSATRGTCLARADACSGGTAGLTAADLTLRRVTAALPAPRRPGGGVCCARRRLEEAIRRQRRVAGAHRPAATSTSDNAPDVSSTCTHLAATTRCQRRARRRSSNPATTMFTEAESAGEANHRWPRTDEAVHSAFDPRIAPSRSRRCADNEDDRVLLGSWL